MQMIAKNYYELLDVARNASLREIDEAYRKALLTFEKDSPALYSLYTPEERQAVLGQVKEAYATLSDKAKKSAYDSVLERQVSVETREIGLDDFGGFENPAPYHHAVSEVRHAMDTYQTVERIEPLRAFGELDPMIIEQYRILFTRLEQLGAKKHLRVFSVSSAVKNEGKSTTSLHLSYVMANEFKKRTLLVECDLRKPSALVNKLDNPDGTGLTEVLDGTADLNSAIKRMEGTDLYILPCGQINRRSPELLASLGELLGVLKSEFDYVILDSPPILPLADMNIISRTVDGVIMVVMAGRTPKELVVKAINSVSSANIVGVVLNGAESSLQKYYY